MAMQTHQDEVRTTEELVIHSKVSKSMLYKLVQEGKVPGQKVGKQWRFLRSLIDEWLKQEAEQGPTEKKRSTK